MNPNTASRSDRPRKYRNQPVEIGGIRFDSKKEARRWQTLAALQSAGAISGLRRQVRIPIILNDMRVCCYIADFVYVQNGRRVVEDVKSKITRRHPVYRLKRKLLQAVLQTPINEV